MKLKSWVKKPFFVILYHCNIVWLFAYCWATSSASCRLIFRFAKVRASFSYSSRDIVSHHAHLLCYNYQALQYRNRVSLKFPSQATLWDCLVGDQWKRQPPLLPYLHLPPPRRASSAAVYAPWKIDQIYVGVHFHRTLLTFTSAKINVH